METQMETQGGNQGWKPRWKPRHQPSSLQSESQGGNQATTTVKTKWPSAATHWQPKQETKWDPKAALQSGNQGGSPWKPRHQPSSCQSESQGGNQATTTGKTKWLSAATHWKPNGKFRHPVRLAPCSSSFYHSPPLITTGGFTFGQKIPTPFPSASFPSKSQYSPANPP